jgi:hypothetical protein
MRRSARLTLQTVVVFSFVVSAVACGGGGGDGGNTGGGPQPPPAEVGAGIQQNVSLSALQIGGWDVCHLEGYEALDAEIDTILAGCVGQYMMLACQSNAGGDLLDLAAADLRSVVISPDDPAPTAHHVSNGVGWYFTPGYSWGFFPGGEAVNRESCDWDPDGAGTAFIETASEKRLCWRSVDNSGGVVTLDHGYRCGANVNLQNGWSRLVLVHP